MRYAELLLALPSAPLYRPATDTPRARAARRRAWQDRDAGTGMADWPQEDKDGWKEDPNGHLETMRVYHIARHPDRIRAPAPWPVEIALIGAGALLMAGYEDRLNLRALRQSAVRYPLWTLIGKAREKAGKRRARQLGLTPSTAPELRFSAQLWLLPVLVPINLWLDSRRRGEPAGSAWELWLASQIVRAIYERRSYNAALKRP
jgi:hypothetical protein